MVRPPATKGHSKLSSDGHAPFLLKQSLYISRAHKDIAGRDITRSKSQVMNKYLILL